MPVPAGDAAVAASREPPRQPARDLPTPPIGMDPNPINSDLSAPFNPRPDLTPDQYRASEAMGAEMAGILVPGEIDFNEAEAAGLPRNSQPYVITMEQAFTLALINSRVLPVPARARSTSRPWRSRSSGSPSRRSSSPGCPRDRRRRARRRRSRRRLRARTRPTRSLYRTRATGTPTSTLNLGDGGRRRQAVHQRRPAPGRLRQPGRVQLHRQELDPADRAVVPAADPRPAVPPRRRPGRHARSR